MILKVAREDEAWSGALTKVGNGNSTHSLKSSHKHGLSSSLVKS